MTVGDGMLQIQQMTPADVEPVAAAFRAEGLNKTAEQLRGYLDEQSEGWRTALVAWLGAEVSGYVTICWTPGYPPFKDAGIPEIQDLNVLPSHRRRGVAGRLMDEAERLVAERSASAGIGVGLGPDYGPAQRMYVLRGYVPDAMGSAWRGRPVGWGDSLTVNDDFVLHLVKALAAAASS